MIIYCNNCWKDNPAYSTLCRYCGAKLDTEDNSTFVTKLIKALSHPEPMTVERAAWILGELKAREAVDALINLLKTSRDMGALEKAAEALGKIGDDRAIDVLSQIITLSYLPARVEAAKALKRIGSPRAFSVVKYAPNDPASTIAQEAENKQIEKLRD